MKQTLDNKDVENATQTYFYLQDVKLEMEYAVMNLKNITDEFMEYEKEYNSLLSKQSEFEMHFSPIRPTEEMRHHLYRLGAYAVSMANIIILGICRMSEAISASGKSLRAIAPNTQIKLNSFKKKYHTPDVINHRNAYLAHPLDGNNRFLTRDELMENIHNITDYKGELSPMSALHFYRYFDEIVFEGNDENHLAIDKIIPELYREIVTNIGCDLKRI